MNRTPPNWLLKALNFICPEHLIDEIEGDLFEHYYNLSERRNRKYANRKALGFIIASAARLILKRKYQPSNHIAMLRNYIIIAFRNIRRRLGYSLINILGLAVGLACCMFIGIYVTSELSYDKFHDNFENIYRVNVTYISDGASGKTYATPTALLPNMQREFNEVKTGTRVFDVSMFSPVIVQKEDVKHQEERFLYADSTFFDVFSFPAIKGNLNKALTNPRSVMLTESTAKKYFGAEDPLGQVIQVGGKDYKITGVLFDIPDDSHIKFDFLASFSSLKASKSEIWWSANYATYVLMNNSKAKRQLESGINEMVTQKLGDDLGDTQMNFDLMSLTDIHLRSDVEVEMQPQSDIKYIYVIGVIGLLILLIACINYMNLATARSAERAREVGMRKVLGAHRKQVFYQFMGESVVITTIAMIIALIIVNLSINNFNQLTGKALNTVDVFSFQLVVGFLIIYLLVSFLAGAYPALSLSSFAMGDVLKGTFKRSKAGSWTRKTLVIVQFSISIFLIMGTLVIYKQLSYMRDKKLGYNNQNVLILPADRQVRKNFHSIKIELEQRDDVESVSIASESPTDIGGGYSITVPGYREKPVGIQALTVEKNFLIAMDMKLVSGRDFTETDHTMATKEKSEERQFGFIVNQELVKTLLTNEEDILGQKASVNGRQGEIVGVVEDFHFTSLHRKINPLVLFIEPAQFNKMFIRIKPDKLNQTILGIEDKWKEVIVNRPFVFEFMDDEYEAMYRSEMRLSNVFVVFAVLAIVIACLGLFGLVSFAVQQRNQEIGVRKVLGASIPNLFFLVSKDFMRLVLISFIISAPLSYWLMDQWLLDFEYRTSVGVLPILISISCAACITFLTVSYQSLKAATMNPVETLRNE